MGDRIGLIFRDSSGEKSDVIVHSHWMGRRLLKYAQAFYKDASDTIRDDDCRTITAKFLLWFGKTVDIDIKDIDIDVQTEDDDCEDNGIWVMDMGTGMIGD